MPPHALVVDDDKENYSRYHHFLDALGFVVHHAADLPQARDMLRAHPVDLQFLDLDMQGAGDFFGINHLHWMHHNNIPVPTIIVSLGADLPQAYEAQRAHPFVRLRVYTPDFTRRIPEINAVIQPLLDRYTARQEQPLSGESSPPPVPDDEARERESDPSVREVAIAAGVAILVILAVILIGTYAPDFLRQPFASWLLLAVMLLALVALMATGIKRRYLHGAADLLRKLLDMGRGRGQDRKDDNRDV